jgi:hypothetical protein
MSDFCSYDCSLSSPVAAYPQHCVCERDRETQRDTHTDREAERGQGSTRTFGEKNVHGAQPRARNRALARDDVLHIVHWVHIPSVLHRHPSPHPEPKNFTESVVLVLPHFRMMLKEENA